MDKRAFGNTGLLVSILGFGAGAIGNSSLSDREAALLLNGVIDAGINLIDTARSYGLSEERIGRHLKHRRSDFVLSTKIGYGISGYQDWTPAIISAGVDYALHVLQTDNIDIAHLHSCPLSILVQDDILRALEEAVRAGKVKVAAYSGDNEPFDWALTSGRVGALQTSINLCDQRAISSLPLASERGLGIIAKRSLANMAWRNTIAGPEDNAAAEYRNRWKQLAFQIKPEENTETALRFVAYLPGVHCCLVGSSNLSHVLENIRMAERGPLPAEVMEHIRSTFLSRGAAWPGQI